MKKKYIEPEFDLLKFRLTDDFLLGISDGTAEGAMPDGEGEADPDGGFSYDE